MSYRDKTWQEIFKHELEVIEDKEILKILDNVFKKVLECHKWLPASSSGKYHPKCDLGEGGLIRHSKVVFQFMEEIIRATPSLKFSEKELSQITFIPGSLNTKRFCLKNWQQKDSRAKTN